MEVKVFQDKETPGVKPSRQGRQSPERLEGKRAVGNIGAMGFLQSFIDDEGAWILLGNRGKLWKTLKHETNVIHFIF